MATLEDIRLGQLAVAQGLCALKEVEDCLAEQHEAELDGKPVQLGEILISRGYLTRSQLQRLLTLQQEAVQRVTRIGQYDLIRKLGEGGMGAVYQAKDTRTNDMVALKVLPRSKAKDKLFLERFEREVRAAFDLDHPNIVRGLDVGHADGYHFLVMEYVRGEDVFAHLSQHGRFTEEDALRIAKDIAAALEHIHGEHLVHRDIKPENILIGQDGTAKLADLGLAIDDDVPNQARITKAGTAMGTPYYLSPEQIRGEEEADIRSDIYSLGATLYEMVSGKPPFEGESPAVVMMKCLQEQVPSPRDIDRTVSVAFCHMLERMMAKDPAERYQTPAELSADISRVQHGETPLGERPETGRSNLARPSQKGPDDSTARRKTPKSDDKLAKEKSPVKTSSPMAAPSDKMEAITEDAITAEWKTKYMILWAIAAGAVMLAILLIWQLAK